MGGGGVKTAMEELSGTREEEAGSEESKNLYALIWQVGTCSN